MALQAREKQAQAFAKTWTAGAQARERQIQNRIKASSQGNSNNKSAVNLGTRTRNNTAQNIDLSKFKSSEKLLAQAWRYLNKNDAATSALFANEVIKRYTTQAQEQQKAQKGFPAKGQESKNWALNDVATAHFILGKAYLAAGDKKNAAAQFQAIWDNYRFAMCYDPSNKSYWKVAVGAKKELNKLGA
jgi:hypothetical protein